MGYSDEYVEKVEKHVSPYVRELGETLMEIPEDVIRHCVLPYIIGSVYD